MFSSFNYEKESILNIFELQSILSRFTSQLIILWCFSTTNIFVNVFSSRIDSHTAKVYFVMHLKINKAA